VLVRYSPCSRGAFLCGSLSILAGFAPAHAELQPPATLAQWQTGTLIGLIASDRWAIGSWSNYGVPRKTYDLAVEGSNVVWRDGVGNVDVEVITYSGAGGFGTATVRSIHSGVGGMPVAQVWDYTLVGAGQVQVRPRGRAAYLLSRC
jgi:hypothetical protein